MAATGVDVDVAVVRALVDGQFPEWAPLPLEPVASAGADNALFRLGDERLVRMPRTEAATAQVEKEHRWLPRLAPRLPLAIPVPQAHGAPGEGYPWPWSVYGWLRGESALERPLEDPLRAAVDIAHFVTELAQVDTRGGPPPGAHNFFRGVPLAFRDEPTRRAIDALDGVVETAAATAAWEAALHAPAWRDRPHWIHGDLTAANLLVEDDRIHAVIDFDCLAVGDPACDLVVAWSVFGAEARDVLRAALAVDDASWARGRGWALSIGLIALPHYLERNPAIAAEARAMIDAVLGDDGG